MKTINPGKNSLLSGGMAALFVLAATANAPAQTSQCVETNGVKFMLPPNVNGGLDVKASRNGIVLADDFFCSTTGPITDIHLWGSWLSDTHGLVTNFWIGIYDDVPAVTNFSSGQITPSHPGRNLLWQQSFGLGQYAESTYATGQEYFYNPTNNLVVGGDTQAWYYCFYPTNPFVQQGTAAVPTNYWLAVRAQLDSQTIQLFGWKTSLVPYHDAAVWGTVDASGLPSGNWQSMTNPTTFQQIDLAFKLTTPTNAPTPVQCVETNGVKYVQMPNLDGGLDVWNNPYVLADDFVCSNSGPITDIHLWGSWLNNQAGTNTLTFWLAIYDDVPLSATNTTFSRPGNLLWQQWFAPGQYAENLYGSGLETFLDPGPPVVIGQDSQAWYYCFYPTNPLVQVGTAAASKTYWLAAYAQEPAGSNFKYGWKTTKFVQNDISVHAPWPGVPPSGNPGWSPTYTPGVTGGGTPLDLAFKITTPTNQCPVPIACALDKTVECGSSWTFDPPLVGPDPCCPVNPTVFFSTVTNNSGPCNESITGTWVITDCAGVVLKVCNQTVTVVDTTPPVITCASNKTVVSGTAWTFDKPTAVDACCGTNVTITVLNTQTNIQGPCQQFITRTWQATDCCTNSSTCSQTVTVVCAPVQCVETNGVKNIQGPNTLGGYDVWNNPYVLADDFVCNFSGPITDIHIWGSWLNNQTLTNSLTFWLGIYDDVPAVPGNTYSHPGTNLLWQQWFAPGQYAETIWTANASEQFLDPGPPQIIGSDSMVWYYCFNPTNAFEQLGTATAPRTYWLAAYAQLPAGIQYSYGWKTTTNVSHDVSVHASWPGYAPTNNPGWKPTTIATTGGPLDLAFKLTTPTNVCGPILIRYLSTNKVVLTWSSGFLQVSPGASLFSTNVLGTYVDVPGATSPYTNDTTVVPLKFYRLRCY